MSEKISDEQNKTYQDIGLGYYAGFKEFFLNAHLAYKIGNSDVKSEEDYDSKFMFQAD